MSSNTFINIWVRQAVASMVERAARDGQPIILRDALAAIRRRFPSLTVSDKVLTAGVMSEAVAAGAKVVPHATPSEFEPSPPVTSDTTAQTVNAALTTFLSEYDRGSRAFAMSDAIQAVRTTVPESELSNNDLLSAIASAGARARLNIAFDVPVDRSKAPAIAEWENEGGAIKSPS